MKHEGGQINLPRNWMELLDALLKEDDIEERKKIVRHLNEEHKAALAWEWKMEKQKRRAWQRRPRC